MARPMLLGDYELDVLLGRGAMGEVWRAERVGPHGFRRPVALKVLTSSSQDAGLLEHLIDEARLGAMLVHPNIAQTYDLGNHGGRWFIAMELVEGPTVRQLSRDSALSARAVIDIGLQTARGLRYLHEEGLIHRDIKESNLVLDPYGQVKIVDLGVATLLGVTGGVAGTPGYMPPEQLRGEPAPASDVFALGVTLFRLVTGERPFGKGVMAARVLRDLPRAVRRLQLERVVEPRVPGLEPVLRACFAPVGQRLSSEALVDALELLALQQRGASVAELLDVHSRPEPAITLELATEGPELVGREPLIEHVADAVRQHALVTLTGIGGLGKSSVAKAVVDRLGLPLLGWVDFAGLSAEDDPGPVLRRSIGVGPAEEGSLAEQLAGRAGVVVLDGGQTVREALSEGLPDVIADAPQVRFLLTARVPLGVEGEHVQPVPPLSPADARTLLLHEAPQLSTASPAELGRLVRVADGLPLTLELLAAQVRRKGLRAVLEDARTVVDREGRRRLRAVLEASWLLLDDEARRALAVLSVFGTRTFGVEAAEAVVELDGRWVEDVLLRLERASLLVRTRNRWRLLRPTAAFAQSRLSTRGRRRASLAHLRHFARHGHPEVLAALRRRGGERPLHRLAVDLPNLRLAVRTAVESGEPEGIAVALAACEALLVNGPLTDVPELVEKVLPLASDPTSRVRLRLCAARAHHLLDDQGAVAREAALARGEAEAVGHAELVAEARFLVARGLVRRGELDPAEALLEGTLEQLALRPVLRACTLLVVGELERARGRRHGALEAYLEASELVTREAAAHVCATTLLELTTCLLQYGELEEAARWVRRATASAEGARYPWAALRARAQEAIILDLSGDLEGAGQTYQRTAREARRLGRQMTLATSLVNAGRVEVLCGRTAEALESLREARSLFAASKSLRNEAALAGFWLGQSYLDRGLYREARRHFEPLRRGRSRVSDPRVALAATLQLSRVAIGEGRMPDAHRHLQDARDFREPDPVGQLMLTINEGVVRALFGDPFGAAELLASAEQAHVVSSQPWLLGTVLLERSAVAWECGAPEEALATGRRARRVLDEVGHRLAAATASAMVAGWLPTGRERDGCLQQARAVRTALSPGPAARLSRLLDLHVRNGDGGAT